MNTLALFQIFDHVRKVFCFVNYHGTRKENFFKRENFGKNNYLHYIQSACAAVGVKGIGLRPKMTCYGLPATKISNLHAAGHSGPAIEQRVGHKQLQSCKHYVRVYGEVGKRQQADIFPESVNAVKRVKIDGSRDTRTDDKQAIISSAVPMSSDSANRSTTMDHGTMDVVCAVLPGIRNNGTLSDGININIYTHGPHHKQ